MVIDSELTWPFLEEDDGLRELVPAELDLSEDLTTDIRVWVDFWREHSDGLLNWDSPAHERRFLERGRLLVERIRAELGADWEVLAVPGITVPGTPGFTPSVPRDPSRPRVGYWGLASPRDLEDPEELRRRPGAERSD